MTKDTSRWPHFGDIAMGLIEARVSGVDFWDTEVGQRLLAPKPRMSSAPRVMPRHPPVRRRHRDSRTGRPR